MSNLTDLPLKLTYRTGRDDLVHGFFDPCLEAAVFYRRAAGGLISVGTSSGLALAARGVASLALRRGRMRLIVSPSRTTAPPWSAPATPLSPACAPSPPAVWPRLKTH